MELCAERDMEGWRSDGEAVGKRIQQNREKYNINDMQGVTYHAVTNFGKTKYRIFEPVI